MEWLRLLYETGFLADYLKVDPHADRKKVIIVPVVTKKADE
jgi:hypothetical protein